MTASPEPANQDEPPRLPTGLLRSLWTNPDDAPERLMLAAVARLGESSWRFAVSARQTNPGVAPRQLVSSVQVNAARQTGIDGAVAGCPFFIALVPAYVAMLWEQARMALRIAALSDRDPRDPEIVAELLWLRRVHPTLPAARAAVDAVRARAAHGRRARPSLRGWVTLGRRFLVLAGFLAPRNPDAPAPPPWRRGLSLVAFAAFWAVTALVPVTFMLAMAFSALTSTKELAGRALAYYGDEAATADAETTPAQGMLRGDGGLLRGAAIAASLGVPLGALAVSAQSHPAGIHWYYVVAALLGLSLVLALGAVSAHWEPTERGS